MFHYSETVESKRVITGDKLMSYAKVLYGVTPENLPVELFQLTLKYIVDNFKGITINDIDLAFQGAEIEKREYVSLTRDELLKPIKVYWNQKELIKSEYNKILEVEKEKIEVLNKEAEFKKQSLKVYIDSLYKNEFLMDEFQSNSIYKHFLKEFSDDEVDIFKIEALREHKERKFKADEEGNPFMLVPNESRIFARIIMEDSFKRKIQISKK